MSSLAQATKAYSSEGVTDKDRKENWEGSISPISTSAVDTAETKSEAAAIADRVATAVEANVATATANGAATAVKADAATRA